MKPITNKLEQNLRERIDAMLAEARKTDTYKNESLFCNIVTTFTDRMKFKKITQKELAKKTDLKESYLSRILTRDCNPTLNTIRKIAEALDLEIKIEPKRSFESVSHIGNGVFDNPIGEPIPQTV